MREAGSRRETDVRERLEDLLDPTSPDDGPWVAGLLRSFLLRMPALLVGLHDALDAHDVEKVGRLAHELKGAALNIGARDAGALSADLEAKGRQGDAAGAEAVLRALGAELVEITGVLSALAAELDVPGSAPGPLPRSNR